MLRQELKKIRQCVDCYFYELEKETNNDWYTFVCNPPHLLVHVREHEEEGGRYWPAKVTKINKKSCYIICFGDHIGVKYDNDLIYLYSDERETDRIKSKEEFLKNEEIFMQREYEQSFEVN